MQKDLIVAIFASTNPKDPKTGVFGTGYPVAEDLILTSRHVVAPENPNTPALIEVKWFYDQPADKKPPAWTKADLVWTGAGDLDAALIRCPRPAFLRKFPLDHLIERKPTGNEEWESTGFALANKRGKVRKPGEFGGTVRSMADAAPFFEVVEGAPPTGTPQEPIAEEQWGGASGMPIFIASGILGILCQIPPKHGNKKLEAVPVWRLLRDEGFKKALGIDKERERRHEEARDALLYWLILSEPLRVALGEAVGIGLFGDPKSQANALADKLLETEIDKAIQDIYRAWDRLGGQRCRVEDRAALCEIIGLILPVRYDEGVIDCARARCSIPEAVFLELPAGIETVAEVIMAGIYGRPARFKPLRDRDTFPEGADALSEPPESGFDSDGSAYEQSVHAHLCNKLLAGDESSFDTFLANTFIKEASIYRADGVKESELAGMVADELEDRATRHNRHFYFVFKLLGRNAERPAKLVAVENLKSRYRPLDFVVLAHAGDGNIIRQERKRFRMLREILPGTTEHKP